MPELVVARSRQPDSPFPYLLWVPLSGRGLIFQAADSWPRTSAVLCQPVDDWPQGSTVIERVPVRSCVRRGSAVELVLERSGDTHAQFVFTAEQGRQVVYWRSPRTVKRARPTTRPGGVPDNLEILVDSRETDPFRFDGLRVRVSRRLLKVGGYAVELANRVVGVVERCTLSELVVSLAANRLDYLMADLAAHGPGAIVVEERYGAVFGLERARPSLVADSLAELQVTWPAVPIFFADSRGYAAEWTFRWLAAARAHALEESAAQLRLVNSVARPR